MSSSITLSAGVRQNLLSLQQTGSLMSTTQNRLASGKKVNSALDNPTNFFTSASLSARSNDLSQLLDSMSNGIKTLEAADNGLSSITKTVESMQSTLRQARQDKSNVTASYTNNSSRTAVAGDKLTFTNGSVGATGVNVSVNKSTNTTTAAVSTIVVGDNGKQFTVSNGTTATANITLATGDTVDAIVTKINSATTTAANGITASNSNGSIVLSSAEGTAITVAEGTTPGGAALLNFVGVAYAAKTTDEIVATVNANTSLTDKVRASNDNGKLRFENQSTSTLNIAGVSTAAGVTGLAGATTTIAGNDVRKNLVAQFNQFRDQLDKLADDASFNGINLLRGDKLKITFNENGSSSIDIQAKDSTGAVRAINASKLGIATAVNADFDSDTTIDSKLDTLTTALNTLRSQSSSFGSNLSVVQNRQDFTKSMMTTLQTGADNLVLADTNEEGANMLALQTRQQLSTTALSLANQANQAVLRLF